MKKRHSIVVATTALLLSACIPSVNPFYTDRDVVFDARLLGEWQEKESDQPEVWSFEQAEDKAYKLTTTDKEGKQGEFKVHLFKLKRDYFLDLVPSDCDYATNQADLVAFAMFPAHLLLRVPQLGPELQLAGLDYDWLVKQQSSACGTIFESSLTNFATETPARESGCSCNDFLPFQTPSNRKVPQVGLAALRTD